MCSDPDAKAHVDVYFVRSRRAQGLGDIRIVSQDSMAHPSLKELRVGCGDENKSCCTNERVL